MQRLVEFVAPRNLPDLLLKALVLVLVFAIFDLAVLALSADWRATRPGTDFILTFLIGAPFGLFVMMIMAQQRLLQIKLGTLAATDMLTGLDNRRAFNSKLADKAAKNESGVLMLVDIDHFKRVNDTYGHDVGDLCLVAIASFLRNAVRKSDVICRMGGEEFAAFLPGLNEQEGKRVSHKLCQPIVMPASAGDGTISLTLSIGATLHVSGDDLQAALKQADDALYQAKSSGRARAVWSSNDVDVFPAVGGC